MGDRQQRNPVFVFKTQGITLWPGNRDTGGTDRRNLNQGRWNLPEEMQAVKRSTQLQCFYAASHRPGPKDCCIVTQFLFIPLLIYLFIHIFIWPPKHAMWGAPDFFSMECWRNLTDHGLVWWAVLHTRPRPGHADSLPSWGDQWLTKPQSRGRFVVRGLVTEQLPILHLWDVFWGPALLPSPGWSCLYVWLLFLALMRKLECKESPRCSPQTCSNSWVTVGCHRDMEAFGLMKS